MDPISETPAIVEFGRFRILPHRRQLLIEGQPIRIGGRAFDVLLALIEARGAAVSKDALISRVWPNRNVEENALQAQISALRDIFGADRDLIRTVRGRGFLFAGNLRDPLAGPLEQPIAASISADAALGEPRDRGPAVGNHSRRWRPSPPHWYWQDPHLRRWRLRPKTPHPVP
jgi:DNA-binding winged helix-turn-helix (wHTH) protein